MYYCGSDSSGHGPVWSMNTHYNCVLALFCNTIESSNRQICHFSTTAFLVKTSFVKDYIKHCHRCWTINEVSLIFIENKIHHHFVNLSYSRQTGFTPFHTIFATNNSPDEDGTMTKNIYCKSMWNVHTILQLLYFLFLLRIYRNVKTLTCN